MIANKGCYDRHKIISGVKKRSYKGMWAWPLVALHSLELME